MEQASAQTIATFTGTLLKRERAAEQKFVQLVFREDDKNWLCVSTDPRMATLAVGQNYHIEGEFKQRGNHEFVYEPKIDILKKHWRPLRRIAFVVVLAVCVAGLGGTAYMRQHTSTSNAARDNSSTPVITPAASKQAAPSQPAATASATTTPAAAPTTPISTTSTRKYTKPKAATTTKPAATSNQQATAPQTASTDTAPTSPAPVTDSPSTTTDTPTVTPTVTDSSTQDQGTTTPADTSTNPPAAG